MRKFNLLQLDAIIQGTFQNLLNHNFIAALRQIGQLEFSQVGHQLDNSLGAFWAKFVI